MFLITNWYRYCSVLTFCLNSNFLLIQEVDRRVLTISHLPVVVSVTDVNRLYVRAVLDGVIAC